MPDKPNNYERNGIIMADSKQSEMIRNALEGIKEVIDENVVLGKPYNAGNTTIIPVTKISVGLAAGGIDYFGKHAPQNDKMPATSFGGGGGTGISVSPVGFLVVKESGAVELLTVDGAANKPTAVGIIDSVLDVIDRSPEIAEKIKAVIAKFKKDKEEEKENG